MGSLEVQVPTKPSPDVEVQRVEALEVLETVLESYLAPKVPKIAGP